MERADVDGVPLEYETHGSGEPAVLLYAGPCADWFRPLVDEPALAGRVDRATHLLHVANPRGMAGALDTFVERHPA